MPDNKVKYGLKNCYYAVLTEGSGGAISYGTPVALPGAVSLSLAAEGDHSRFYADDGVYFTIFDNTGYTGSLELALVPDSFRTAILGETADSKNVLVEKSGVTPTRFALLFEFTGDQKQTRHVFYNCTASRPDVAANTKGETTEVQTETINIDAGPIALTSGGDYIVKAKTGASTDTTTYNGWYSAVYTPTAGS